MTKIISTYLLNVGPTPQEIKTFRKEVVDFHLTLGTPVIFKHRWNLQDLQNGLCQKCPLHDYSYERSKTDCEFCFGTGFLGGFDDGIILFATISDAPVDQLKIDKSGYILFDRHPQFTTPWYPDMGDGDLVITAEFDRATWSVLSTKDRFELNEVTPVTVRGFFGDWTDYKLYKVQQTAQVDRVPNQHVYYNVPVVFDSTNTPIIIPPIGADPDDFIGPFSSTQMGLRISGKDGTLSSTTSLILKINGDGLASTTSQTLKIIGKSPGAILVF